MIKSRGSWSPKCFMPAAVVATGWGVGTSFAAPIHRPTLLCLIFHLPLSGTDRMGRWACLPDVQCEFNPEGAPQGMILSVGEGEMHAERK